MKKILSMLMALLLMVSSFPVGIVSSAMETENVDSVVIPRFTTISNYSVTLDISGLTATVDASLTPGYYTNLKIVAQLQKKTSTGYEDVKTWTTSKDSGVYLSLNESKIINPFNNYRLRITYTADQETIIVFKYDN